MPSSEAGLRHRVRQADTVLLSADVDGTYLVRKYLVKQHADRNSDYAVRYQVDVAQLSSTLAGNARQLDDLQAFIDKVSQDKSLRVTGVTITGYASPDGPYAPNERLAHKRATDFRNYVDSRYRLSASYPVTVSAVVDEWRAAVPARGGFVDTFQAGGAANPERQRQGDGQGDAAQTAPCGVELHAPAYPAADAPCRDGLHLRQEQRRHRAHAHSAARSGAGHPCDLHPCRRSADGLIIDMDEFDCTCTM